VTDRLTPPAAPRPLHVGQPVIELTDVSKRYPISTFPKRQSVAALTEVNLAVYPGEVVALVGESGSGKSTVLKLIARLEEPTKGQIRFQGRDILKEEPRRASLAYRRQVQMIFQDPFASLNPMHSVAYHLERPLLRHKRAQGREALHTRVLELLNSVGLSPAEEFAQKMPHQMSGGQRQRVAIARALAVEPALILADEPISMLDVSIRIGILNLMDEQKARQGIAYLYVTHDIASARYIAERTMVMYAGHLVEGGPSELLLSNPAHPYTRLLVEAVPKPGLSIARPLSATSGHPNLVDPGPGCPFAGRCPLAIPICRQEMPAPRAAGRHEGPDGHFVRCHQYSESPTRPDESHRPAAEPQGPQDSSPPE
jgi:peptide/nickel transport system ATP-binding protein